MATAALAYNDHVAKDPALTFGKHKGTRLSAVPADYLRFLANPIGKDQRRYAVPTDISRLAAARLVLVEAAEQEAKRAALRMGGAPADTTDYVISREGDIDGLTIHASLEAALKHLATVEYPISDGGTDWNNQPRGLVRSTPDPEDDRILIWEVLPSGHRKVVWQFAGYHFDTERYGLEQGTLPGDEASLYSIAMA